MQPLPRDSGHPPSQAVRRDRSLARSAADLASQKSATAEREPTKPTGCTASFDLELEYCVSVGLLAILTISDFQNTALDDRLGNCWRTNPSLLDWTGRQLRGPGQGSIPTTLAPILERLGLKVDGWVETTRRFGQWFKTAVGHRQSLTGAVRHLVSSYLDASGSAAGQRKNLKLGPRSSRSSRSPHVCDASIFLSSIYEMGGVVPTSLTWCAVNFGI